MFLKRTCVVFFTFVVFAGYYVTFATTFDFDVDGFLEGGFERQNFLRR